MVIQKNDFQKTPLIRPRDLLKKVAVCPQALVVFDSFDWNSVLAKTQPVPESRRNLKFCSLQTIRVNNQPITLAGPGTSAPVAAMILEVLIAFGTRRIIGVGSCGSLDERLRIGHFVIPQNAIPDEGTSYHYPLPGKKIKASPRIFKRIQSLCELKAQTWVCGKVWTTDAPFRETPPKIKKAKHQKAIAVEMELSAFLKVGAFYGVEVGALLVVSDELFARQWNPGYNTQAYKKAFVKSIDIALQILSQPEEQDERRQQARLK